MSGLQEAFGRAAAGAGTLTVDGAGGRRSASWQELHDDALRAARVLRERGIGPGTTVALLADTSFDVVSALHAVWLLGAAVTCLQPPTRRAPGEHLDAGVFAAQCRSALRRTQADLLLIDDAYAPIGALLPCPQLATGELREGPPLSRPQLQACVPAGSDVAIKQHTSGTTSRAKVALVSYDNLLAQLGALRTRTDHDAARDVLVSWLPLFHDMGLVGFLLLPMSTGCRLVLTSPRTFAARPASWLELMHEHRATATAAPNFAYALAARLLATGPTYDLSQIRFALSGGEPIDADAVDRFAAAAARHGFRPSAFTPAFGMAESTLAVTMSPVGRAPVVDSVDRVRFDRDGLAQAATNSPGARRFVLLGTPLPGMEVRVVEPGPANRTESAEPAGLTGPAQSAQSALPDRTVGELQIRGTSVIAAYGEGEGDTATRTPSLVGGWLPTGDLAYLTGGELVVCGRRKDVIIMAGRNLYPEDVERIVGDVLGVRTGNVIATRCRSAGGEGLAVLAEIRDPGAAARIERELQERIEQTLGVRARRVLLLPPGRLPKTPSGKLRRSAAAAELDDRDAILGAG